MSNWTNPNEQGIVQLAKVGSLSGAGSVLVPAGGQYSPVTLVNVSQFASYDINLSVVASSPGSVGAALAVPVVIQWFDDTVSNIPVFEEDWWIWCGRANTAFTNTLAGCGPMHGQYMTVTIQNNFASFGVTVQYLNLFGSNRILSYSDWRQNMLLVQPQSSGVTLQQSVIGDSFDNLLASINNANLGASALVFVPLGLYSGPVYYRYQSSAVPLHNVVIASVQGETGGSLVAGTGNTGVLVNLPADTLEHEGTFFAPRSALAFIYQANAAGASLSFQAVAQQAA